MYYKQRWDTVTEESGGVYMAPVGSILWCLQVVPSLGVLTVDGIKSKLRKITTFIGLKKSYL